MLNFCFAHLLFIQLIFTLKAHCLFLDITQKRDYDTPTSSVKVEKLTLHENAYGHKFEQPSLLSDIVENGQSVLFDKLFFREQPVEYATVFWENDDPTVVHVYTNMSTVVLLSNGNGRFTEESILSDKFVTNSEETYHPGTETEVTLDLGNTNDYDASGVEVHVTEVDKFDQRLNPYKVTYQNVDNFRVNGLRYNDTTLNVPLDDTVNGVYVYAKDDNPLLVELVTTTASHKYYVPGGGDTWEQTLLPSIFDPMYNTQFIKKLKSFDGHCQSRFVLDFGIRTPGTHEVTVNCQSDGRRRSMHKNVRVHRVVRRVLPYFKGNLEDFLYQMEPRARFVLDGLRFNNTAVKIALPPGPYESVRVYFYKCPLVIHFLGPNTNTYFEFVKFQPFRLFKQGANLSSAEIDKKIDEVMKRHALFSPFFYFAQ